MEDRIGKEANYANCLSEREEASPSVSIVSERSPAMLFDKWEEPEDGQRNR